MCIRGGTVVDGTGAPARAGRRRHRGRPGRRGRADGSTSRVDPDIDADGPHRVPGLRRPPHALRHPGVLGSHAVAVAAARRHHRDRRQLRLLRRAARRQRGRLPDAHARPGRGDAHRRRWRPRATGTGRRSAPTSIGSRARLVPNAGFLVGHSAVRRVVMGEAACEREATADEIDAMRRLLGASLAEGGLGFSSSWAATHNDFDGEPVPSRFAGDRRAARAVRRGRSPRGHDARVHPRRRPVHRTRGGADGPPCRRRPTVPSTGTC